jgi:glutathione synthase/RimK-type ligase-like ATP-grasp enzyme
VALAEHALRVLPGARFAGLDIAVATGGPLVVEYNVEPDQRGAAHLDLPHAQVLRSLPWRKKT